MTASLIKIITMLGKEEIPCIYLKIPIPTRDVLFLAQ